MKGYPHYGVYILKVSLPIWSMAGLFLHFWKNDWSMERLSGSNNIMETVFWVFFMILFDYLRIFYKKIDKSLSSDLWRGSKIAGKILD